MNALQYIAFRDELEKISGDKKLEEMTPQELLKEYARTKKTSKRRQRLAAGLLIAGAPLATILAGRFGTKAMAAAGGGTLAAGLATAVSSGRKKRRSRKALAAFSGWSSRRWAGQVPPPHPPREWERKLGEKHKMRGKK